MELDGIANKPSRLVGPAESRLQPLQQLFPEGTDRRSAPATPPYIVNLSNAAKERAANSSQPGSAAVVDGGKRTSPAECQTCKNRRYVDRSNDATVSFQAPTRLSPGAAESAVRAHEQEHVSNEQARASENGNKVVFQSVAIHYAVCPECGSSYVSGGTTTTVTKSDTSSQETTPLSGKGVDARV